MPYGLPVSFYVFIGAGIILWIGLGIYLYVTKNRERANYIQSILGTLSAHYHTKRPVSHGELVSEVMGLMRYDHIDSQKFDCLLMSLQKANIIHMTLTPSISTADVKEVIDGRSYRVTLRGFTLYHRFDSKNGKEIYKSIKFA